MKKKPYLHHEDEPMILGEPAVSYQRTVSATYRPVALPNEVKERMKRLMQLLRLS
ncbi:MAG: hypothetical protein IKA75_06215 [Bacteroidaceae bacterium]|nr:hypothetical protein [Bacteroidaceae bacterium]